jgi:hypothetical protein
MYQRIRLCVIILGNTQIYETYFFYNVLADLHPYGLCPARE